MSRRMIGIVTCFAVSETLGILLSVWFFRLFLSSVPPLALSTLNQQAARVAFTLYGMGGGVLIFLWSLLSPFVLRIFQNPRTKGLAV